MRYMLDTNILIELIRGKSDALISHLRQHSVDEFGVSAVTYTELMHGVEKSADKIRNKVALTLLMARFNILDYGTDAANCYGKIRADLEHKGTPIGPLDTMIAAHAKSLGLVLVTNNTSEFSRVDGLEVENWVN